MISELIGTHLLADASANPLVNISKTFHLHTANFIAQIVSFVIVLILLKKYAFGPITQMLEERSKRIAQGEEKLKQIELQLAESERNAAAAIAKANEEAARLVQEAKASASSLSEQKAQEAISQAQQIIAKAHAAAEAERAAIRAELKGEFGRLVAATTAQVTGKVLTPDDQVRINQEALATVER